MKEVEFNILSELIKTKNIILYRKTRSLLNTGYTHTMSVSKG